MREPEIRVTHHASRITVPTGVQDCLHRSAERFTKLLRTDRARAAQWSWAASVRGSVSEAASGALPSPHP